MSYVYGDASKKGVLPGMLITLEPVGPVTVTTSAHTLLLVGESARGPTDLVGMTSAVSAGAYYYSGDLKEAIEDAFGEGVPRVFAKRVMPSDCVIATVTLDDGLDAPSDVLTIDAKSAGAWGNANSLEISACAIKHAYTDYFNGNGLDALYSLDICGFINPQPTSGFVKVGGVARTIVYAEEDLATGKVWLDAVNGTLKFYTDALPAASDQIAVSLWYYGVDVRMTDNETVEWRTDIKDLDDFVDALNSSTLMTATKETGATHLPAIGSYSLTGGDDGSAITADDWEQSLYEAGNDLGKLKIVPTSVALTAYEVQENSYDLHAIASAWAMTENVKFRPTIVYVPFAPDETPDNVVEESMKVSNRHLAKVYPSWDESEVRKNLAVCHAAREAAVPFGESVAADENRLKSVNGLHGDLENTINEDYVRALTARGIYVVVKTDAGVGPVKGITTDKVDQFSRTVDQRTANWIIVGTHNILSKFFYRRNDNETREAMKTSVNGFLVNERDISRSIYDFQTAVWPDSNDPNMVHFAMKFIPMGHVEWIDVQMRMGVYTDLQQLQEA